MMSNKLTLRASLHTLRILALISGVIATTSASAQTSVVTTDLLAVGGTSTGWQECGTDATIVDAEAVGNGGCAYQEFSVVPGAQYRLTCGVNSTKYASMTFAFLDKKATTITDEVVEINGDKIGSYSITLTASLAAATGAIGVYGEHGTNVQDCVVINLDGAHTPTEGSISGVTWLDENGDGIQDNNEPLIANTRVDLLFYGAFLDQTHTDSTGAYYFGNVHLDDLYEVRFRGVDPTLTLTTVGNDSVANPSNRLASDIFVGGATPNVTAINAGYVQVTTPIDVPTGDNTVCGLAWNDANADGVLNNGEAALTNFDVNVIDNSTGFVAATATTGADGSYEITGIADGNYALQADLPLGFYFPPAVAVPTENANFVDESTDEMTSSVFNLPADSNTEDLATCTLIHANVAITSGPTAIEPTVVNDEYIYALVGEHLEVDVSSNDDVCEASVLEVDILGHNVPGNVALAEDPNKILITNTTGAGDFSVQYGVRGVCGSYDEGTLFVKLSQPTQVSTQINYCRFRDNGQVVELYRDEPETTSAALADFVPPISIVVTDSNGGATSNLIANTGWIASDSSNGQADNNTTVRSLDLMPTPNADHDDRYVWGAQLTSNSIPVQPVTIFPGNTNTVVITSTDGTTYTKECVTIASPIALDLNLDEKIDRLSGTFMFDLDGNGEAEPLAQWFAPSEGILYDTSVEGDVINGNHLFGNVAGEFENGFQKLATLDKDDSGSIEGDELKPLAIWTDANQNAVLDAGESKPISEYDVVSLSTTEVMFKSTALLSDGTAMLTEDVWFEHFDPALEHVETEILIDAAAESQ